MLIWADRKIRAMGSVAELMVCIDEAEADDLADWGVEQLRRLERLWSRFDPTSELCRINASPDVDHVVSPETFALVDRAIALWRSTDGRFDPTVLAALEAVGYDRSFEQVLQRARPRPADCMPTPGCIGIKLNHVNGTVNVPRGVRLDLGGVGKGFAADCVAAWLIERGATSACIGMGGDIRVSGECPIEGGWPITVENPINPGVPICVAPVTSGAIVMSSVVVRSWPTASGHIAHHLIEPSTGRPSTTGLLAVAVQADEAWWAEGLAKAALLAGPVDGQNLLRFYGVGAWLVADDGTITTVVRSSTLQSSR